MISALSNPGRGFLKRVRKGKTYWDYDAIEGFPPFFPILCFRPVHIWNWRMKSTEWSWEKRTNVYSFRAIPIRWSMDLLARTYLRIWLWVPMGLGLLGSFSCAHGLFVRSVAFLMFLSCLGGLLWIWKSERTDRKIRLLLGRHKLGTSDPTTWTDDLLRLVAPAKSWFGEETFAASVEPLLKEQRFSEAMWAARLCKALENDFQGQQWTIRVIQEAENRGILAEMQRTPKQTKQLLNRQHPLPLPVVRNATGEDAEFWYTQIFEKPVQTDEVEIYAQHIGGQLAMAFAPDEPEDEEKLIKEIDSHKKRMGPQQIRFFLAGIGIFLGIWLLVVGFLAFANAFRLPTLAEKMINEAKQKME